MQDVEDLYPLSPLQEGLLFHSLSDPTSRMYFNQTLATLRGDLDVDAFRRAWATVVDHHPILRTFFVWEGVEQPVQVVKRSAEMPLEVQDWRGCSAEERESRIEELRRADLERGFDLSQAPLMRAVLMRTADDSHDLFWSFHHILMDGWSMFHVLGQMFGAYDALAADKPFEVETSRPYRDYIRWLKQQSLPRAEAFWRENLAGFTATTPLPTDSLPASDEGAGAGEEDFESLSALVPAETTTALSALASKHRLTLNTILQGSWALLLSRTSGENDVLFGSVVSGRPPDLDGVEGMVGLFINSLPVRVRVPAGATTSSWLSGLQAEQAVLRDFEYSPLVEVQGWSDVPRGTSLFESLFLFENYHKDTPLEEMCRSLQVSDIRWYERHNFPIAAVAIPGPEELELRIIHQTHRFSEQAVQRMLGHWRTLLEGMVADPDAELADLPILTAEEREQLVTTWNDTGSDYPRNATIHGLFEEQAARTPDAVALRSQGESMSYGELNRRSNQLAHHLRGLGVGPEVQVGLCLERSFELMVAILGILKAGGAYVSLDPDYPRDRLSLMLTETATPVLLTQQSLATSLPAHDARVIPLDTGWDAIAGESEENPNAGAGAEDLAYVIYTSGSTGRPKGTCVPHRAVVRLVRDTNFAQLDASQVFLQFATVSFDASTLELWGSLLNGARLVLFPAGTPSLEDLERVLREEGVTILWLTAGLFHQMMEQRPGGLSGLKQLLVGGDVLSVPHVRTALETLDGCTVINGYGPTENTTFTCCYPMTDPAQVGRSVPIGRPIANTTVYILDDRMRPVPVGVTGTLYTGGDGLARGYLDRPELTDERFVPDPFGPPGARLYDTGDRARWRADGIIEFLGRDDHQVKVRGFRIELGEIEVTLGHHGAVRDAVVMAREDTPGDKRLVAYVVCDTGAAPGADQMRAFLREQLPEYMIPTAFVTLDAFPLTSNGKVDRRALPTPEGGRPELETAFAAPTADIERAIADIWQQTLGVDQVGVNDNFFDLGGHSLHLIRVHGRLKEDLGRDIPMVDMFRFPTVSALAEHLGSDGDAGDDGPADATEKIEAGKTRLARLAQRRKRRDG